MPTFVTTLVDAMATNTVAFASAVITTYWAYILGIGFVIIIGSKFLRMARFTRHG